MERRWDRKDDAKSDPAIAPFPIERVVTHLPDSTRAIEFPSNHWSIERDERTDRRRPEKEIAGPKRLENQQRSALESVCLSWRIEQWFRLPSRWLILRPAINSRGGRSCVGLASRRFFQRHQKYIMVEGKGERVKGKG